MTTTQKNDQPTKVVERQPSKIYAIKSFKAIVTKLTKCGLITPEEQAELKKLDRRMMDKYVNEN